MPEFIYPQHHILLNLKENPVRVENWRDGEYRDFVFNKDEIVVTPAGVKSRWRWHEKSKVIVVTLEPEKLKAFCLQELGVLLGEEQLKSVPQFVDPDLVQAAVMMRDSLTSELGSAVMFESFSRIFLTKLVQRYGSRKAEEVEFHRSFTPNHYKRVLDFVSENFGQELTTEQMAEVAGLSTSHFTRLFKRTIGQSPHRFVVSYRIERSKAMLMNQEKEMIDIALACGFSDQAHFSRVFKKSEGLTPRKYRLTTTL